MGLVVEPTHPQKYVSNWKSICMVNGPFQDIPFLLLYTLVGGFQICLLSPVIGEDFQFN